MGLEFSCITWAGFRPAETAFSVGNFSALMTVLVATAIEP
jgi:hypothetical protein